MLKGWMIGAGAVALALFFHYQGDKMSLKPRGIRNNNPGNLRISGDNWQGKVPVEENTDGQFEQFYRADDGIRATARNLYTGYLRGARTPEQVITRWAPPTGQDRQGNAYTQNTESYINQVSRATGVPRDRPIPPDRVADLVAAIIAHENGIQPYSMAVIKNNVKRAGWSV